MAFTTHTDLALPNANAAMLVWLENAYVKRLDEMCDFWREREEFDIMCAAEVEELFCEVTLAVIEKKKAYFLWVLWPCVNFKVLDPFDRDDIINVAFGTRSDNCAFAKVIPNPGRWNIHAGKYQKGRDSSSSGRNRF